MNMELLSLDDPLILDMDRSYVVMSTWYLVGVMPRDQRDYIV